MNREFPRLFRYLDEASHAESWVVGGKIPISLASSYKSQSRDGIMTPDENLIYTFARPIESYRGVIGFAPGSQIRGLTFCDNTLNGKPLPNEYNASRYVEDGLILSLCSTASAEIMQRFKKKFCVEITKPDLLLKSLEVHFGPVSKIGACEYTSDHRRDHFLKAVDDSWQDEYRFFWNKTDEPVVWVEIPPVAMHVTFAV